jgi:hypothetical protein
MRRVVTFLFALAVVSSLLFVVPSELPVSAVEASHYDDQDGSQGPITMFRTQGWRATSIDGVQEIRRLRANGTFSDATTANPGDLVLVKFESATMKETFSTINRTNTTDRFLRMLETTDAALSVVQENPTVEQWQTEFALEDSVSVFHDTESATFYVGIDTRNTTLLKKGEEEILQNRRLEDGAQYKVVITPPETNSSGTQDLYTEFIFEDPDAELRDRSTNLTLGEPGTLDADASPVQVNLESNIPPRSTLQLRAATGSGRTLATRQLTTTNEYPTWANTTLDVGDLSVGQEVVLSASYEGKIISDDGHFQVVEPSTPTATRTPATSRATTRPGTTPTMAPSTVPQTTRAVPTTATATTAETGPGLGALSALIALGVALFALRQRW